MAGTPDGDRRSRERDCWPLPSSDAPADGRVGAVDNCILTELGPEVGIGGMARQVGVEFPGVCTAGQVTP